MQRVKPGIQVLLEMGLSRFRGQRIGLITNHSGTDGRLVSTVDLLAQHPNARLTALFSPEHGLRGAAPAGAQVASSTDPVTGLPVYSLYGATRKPSPEMLADIDLLLFDLQDAGSRYYTYTWSMALCLQAAAEQGKRFIVLDRPNPITGRVEGGLVQPGFDSFVGLYPVPNRHGLTHGEIARWLNDRFRLGCDLEVIPMAGWTRSMWWEETGLPFVPMSPNANGLEMLTLYPGTCLVEGTNLSEGRGTALPFQLFGAPWLNEQAVVRALQSRHLPGVLFRPAYFTPTASKHAGSLCHGVQIHIIDRDALRPVALGAHILDVCRQLHPDSFQWVSWGTGQRPAIDLLAGSDRLRERIDAGQPVASLLEAWAAEAEAFAAESQAYHLYR